MIAAVLVIVSAVTLWWPLWSRS